MTEVCAPSMGANLWGASLLWEYRLGLIVSKDNHESTARADPRGNVRRKPECKRCEATDRNRIVKAQGCEASWHMTAKPTGTQPTVNAALVHRQFAFLPGEICAEGGALDDDRPGSDHTGNPRSRRCGELPAACDESAASTIDNTARRAATRVVTTQESADAIVGGQESGRSRAEQRDTRSRHAALARIAKPDRVRCVGGWARTEP